MSRLRLERVAIRESVLIFMCLRGANGVKVLISRSQISRVTTGLLRNTIWDSLGFSLLVTAIIGNQPQP